MDYKIRRMTFDDIAIIIELERGLFREPWSELMFMEEINTNGSYVLCETGNNSIVGYVCGWRVMDEFHITNLGVAKDYQKQGLGSELVQYIIDHMIRQGLKKFYLEVRQSNVPALLLYVKFGFNITGIKKEYYKNPQEDAIQMMWQHEKKQG